MSKDKLIPNIRFPEFLNKEDWKVKTIDELCDILNNIRKPISSGDRKKGSYPYYGASGIIDYVDDFLFDERLLLIGEDGAKWGAYENTAFLVEGKYWVNNHAHVLKPKLINDKLLESYLVKLDLHPYITGAAPPKLTLGKLKEIPVPVPENETEQHKIASCLCSLDEVITAHSQKFFLLKNHKKGLMQNLFPQEGEKVPKLRFKEFEKDGDWVEKAINKLVPKNEKYGIVDGPFGSNLKTIHYKSEGIPIITSGYVTDGIFKADKYLYVTEEKYNEEKRSSVKGGDIVMAKIGARCGASAIMPENHRIGILSGNALKITIDKSEHSTNFIWQQLWHLHSNDKFSGIKSIGAQPAISMDSLKKFELTIPPRIEEQKKIASCVSSLDALITAHAEKIEQLKLYKKGLMQGLFPKIND